MVSANLPSHPENSASASPTSSRTGGWGGIARWPHSAQNGPASAAPQFKHFTRQATEWSSALTLVRNVLSTSRTRVLMSLPLDRRRRFGAYVVDNPVDSPHFVDDAVRDSTEHVVRKL